MSFLYNIALYFLAFLALPKVWKRKKCLRQRLGLGFPDIKKEGRPLIWIHAVSFGETKAVGPLVRELQRLKEKPLILLSTSTETGHHEGKTNIASADYHVYLPFDFSTVIKPIVRRVCPDLVLIMESDFWWNFQKEAFALGAQLVLINGKLSERSYKRHLRFPFFSKRLFHPFSKLCLQGPLYQKRFLDLGVDPKKIVITGNIKLDAPTPSQDMQAFKRRLGLHDNDLVLTCGSTHEGEEELLLSAYQELHSIFPTLKLLLVPRHPERFESVTQLIEEKGLSYVRFSRERPEADKHIVLIDAMGQLKSCYQISTIAFVGGSFKEKVGGHNIIEPCFYGVPTLFGPYMHSQPDFLELVKNYNAGRQVTAETLLPTLKELLHNPQLAREMGQNGLKLIEEARGALLRTLAEISPLLQMKR